MNALVAAIPQNSGKYPVKYSEVRSEPVSEPAGRPQGPGYAQSGSG
jgi:hypothetical protein